MSYDDSVYGVYQALLSLWTFKLNHVKQSTFYKESATIFSSMVTVPAHILPLSLPLPPPPPPLSYSPSSTNSSIVFYRFFKVPMNFLLCPACMYHPAPACLVCVAFGLDAACQTGGMASCIWLLLLIGRSVYEGSITIA